MSLRNFAPQRLCSKIHLFANGILDTAQSRTLRFFSDKNRRKRVKK